MMEQVTGNITLTFKEPALIKKVGKFGPRGAHVILHNSLIGKEVYVILKDSCNITINRTSLISASIEPPSPGIPKDVIKEAYETPAVRFKDLVQLDEAEEMFMDQYRQASEIMKGALYARAVKQFGKGRVMEMMGK